MKTGIITFFCCIIILKSKAQDLDWNIVSYTTGSLSGIFNSIGNPVVNVSLNITGYTAGLTTSYPVKYTAIPDAGTGTTCASICALRSVPNFSDPANQSLILTFTFSPAISPLTFPIYDVDGNGSTRDSVRVTASGPTGAQVITMTNVDPTSSTIFGSGTTSAIAKGLNGNNNDAQTNVTISGFINTLVVTYMGRSSFSIGNMNWSNALPVKWISFSGKKQNNDFVNLHWVTANEQNADVYKIEKSEDGQSFLIIGEVPALNKDNNEYFYVDAKPGTGNTFYRIIQVDIDNQYDYSGVVLIRNNELKNEQLIVFPNPAINTLTISSAENAQLKNIQIFDAMGQLIRRYSYVNNRVDVSTLNPGLYFLRVENISGVYFNKYFIKQ